MNQPRDRDGEHGPPPGLAPTVSPPIRATYDLRTRATLIDLQTFAGWAKDLVAAGKPAYDQSTTNRLAGEAIISRLGEAVTRISDEFKADHPGVPWRAIRNTRNLAAHEYDLVDHDANWQMLATGLPMIMDQLGPD